MIPPPLPVRAALGLIWAGLLLAFLAGVWAGWGLGGPVMGVCVGIVCCGLLGLPVWVFLIRWEVFDA